MLILLVGGARYSPLTVTDSLGRTVLRACGALRWRLSAEKFLPVWPIYIMIA